MKKKSTCVLTLKKEIRFQVHLRFVGDKLKDNLESKLS